MLPSIHSLLTPSQSPVTPSAPTIASFSHSTSSVASNPPIIQITVFTNPPASTSTATSINPTVIASTVSSISFAQLILPPAGMSLNGSNNDNMEQPTIISDIITIPQQLQSSPSIPAPQATPSFSNETKSGKKQQLTFIEYTDTNFPHKRPKSNNNRDYQCSSCGSRSSPEWRRGPNGPKTLCNACGIKYVKKKDQEQKTKQQQQQQQHQPLPEQGPPDPPVVVTPLQSTPTKTA